MDVKVLCEPQSWVSGEPMGAGHPDSKSVRRRDSLLLRKVSTLNLRAQDVAQLATRHRI